MYWVGLLQGLLADEEGAATTSAPLANALTPALMTTSPEDDDHGDGDDDDEGDGDGGDEDQLISGTNASEDELASLPALLHLLDHDHKRAALMRARVPASSSSSSSSSSSKGTGRVEQQDDDEEEEEQEEQEGDSVLHYAARRGYTFWCDALLRRDARLDEPNLAHGFTPLHCAIAGGHLRCVRCLVQYGASLEAGPRHPSAVEVARRFGRTEILDFLNHYMATSTVKSDDEASDRSSKGLPRSNDNRRVLTVGICGATSSGKSTLVKALIKHYNIPSYIRFDNFWKSYNEMPREQGYVHGECPDALRYDEFVAYLHTAQYESEFKWTKDTVPLLFVDGFLLFCDEKYLPLYDIKIFLPISKQTCKQRRCSRDPGTSDDYFERIIWPSYCKWNSYPLERWHTMAQEGGGSALLQGVEKDGIFFINGEENMEHVFRCAVAHIDARLKQHQADEH